MILDLGTVGGPLVGPLVEGIRAGHRLSGKLQVVSEAVMDIPHGDLSGRGSLDNIQPME